MPVDAQAQALVMTVLEARVAPDRWAELVRLYQGGSIRLPAQMLQTMLVQAQSDPQVWRGISVWRSRAALEEYRRSVQTPGGIAMFRAVGAEPALSIWTIGASAPVFEA